MQKRRAQVLRLAGFPLGLGLTLVLVSGTLNRVLIVELDMPASLVGVLYALTLLVAPARMWLGYVSDGYPIWGKRREPYILLGAIVAGIAILAAVLIATNSRAAGIVIAAALVPAFLAYALGSTLASNTFEALVADTFSGDQRPRAVTGFKIAMFAGIMGGALVLGRLLDPFDTGRFVTVVAGAMAAFVALAVVAVTRQEPAHPAIDRASRQATAAGFMPVLRAEVWSNPHARRFFVLVVLSVLGTLAQDVLLEPYGALVLDMSVAQTTRLTAIWGSGTILAMLAAGGWLIRRYGHLRMLRVGLALNMGVFGGILATGAAGQVPLFLALVFALGIGTGLSMAGLLTAVIEFTTFTRAGLLMGVWGMAAEFGQALGGVLGGVVVDVMGGLTGDALVAYGAVFLTEAILLGVAYRLSLTLPAQPAPPADARTPSLEEYLTPVGL